MNTKKCTMCEYRMVKIIRAVKGFNQGFWICPNCNTTAPLRGTPPKAPDITAYIGPVRLAWLRTHGGIQPWIKKQVDEAMEKERLENESNN